MTPQESETIKNPAPLAGSAPRMAAGVAIWYENWNDHASTEFICWWVKFYGALSDFDADDLESDAADDYYIRMSFALMGWLANEEMRNETD